MSDRTASALARPLGERIQRFEDETLVPVGVHADKLLDHLAAKAEAGELDAALGAELHDADRREALFRYLVEASVDAYLSDRAFANRLRTGAARTALDAFMAAELARRLDRPELVPRSDVAETA
jgi:hypothetical protein